VAEAQRRSTASHNQGHEIIVRELEAFLGKNRIRRAYIAEHSIAPSLFAYTTNFPRLSIPLKGCHKMELAHHGQSEIILPARGDAVFVPDHAWNNPDWSSPVHVLTFLFGAKQIGISLVRHNGKTEVPTSALKTSIFGAYDTLTHNILSSLLSLAAEKTEGALSRLLTETLLHSCLRLLKAPPSHRSRKATRTYESLCLYVQENFQRPLSRETVAEYFELAPNHVSRIFRAEGLMRFNDYLNLVRVNRAKFMLQNYRMTLKEIAAKCGYSDTAYFCRVFKKITKVTPTTYRSDDSHRLVPGSKRFGAARLGAIR
jgi:AraC-like DNA-binding protein